MVPPERSRSERTKRRSYLLGGFLIAFSLILVAFEFKVIEKERAYPAGDPIEDPLFVEEARPVKVVKPKVPEREKRKEKPVDPNLRPEVKKKERAKDPTMDSDDLTIEEKMGDDMEKEAEIKVPDYKKGPRNSLQVEILPCFHSCMSYEDPQRRARCTQERVRDYLRTQGNYEPILRSHDVSGTMHLRFVIDEKGRITDVKVAKSPHPRLTEEVKKVLKTMPEFYPGKQGGHPVKVWYSVPLKFATY